MFKIYLDNQYYNLNKRKSGRVIIGDKLYEKSL